VDCKEKPEAIKVTELHGCIYEASCKRCNNIFLFPTDVRRKKQFISFKEVEQLSAEERKLIHETDRTCPTCKLPDVYLQTTVLLPSNSSKVPEKVFRKAEKEMKSSDLCLIIGASLNYSAPFNLSTSPETLVVITKEKNSVTESLDNTILVFNEDCDKIMRELTIQLDLREKFNQFCTKFKI
jgi:NAD-dependent SIR2 family protein deacetylase